MDPYLEGDLWTTVHAQLAAEYVRQLIPKLRPRYVALMEKRFVLELPDEIAVATADLYPDVGVADTGQPASENAAAGVVAAPLRIATVMPSPVSQFSVEIRDTAERQLVTAIEILSPTNKRGDGRREYLAKRQRLLLSPVHLLEIDLLREGQRVPMRQPLPLVPYFAFLSRASQRPITETWPVRLDQPLPAVPVPLLEGDPDVSLDLQLALSTVYDQCGLDLAVDYSRPPEVALSPEAEAWVVERLRSAGSGT
jgi:hypothetical protein